MASTKTCGCCNTSKNFTQFYKSPVDGEYVAICKNCCRKKFKKYQQTTGSDSAALWLCLAEIGVPFYSGIWKQTETYMATAGPNTDIVMCYLRYLVESGIVVEGFWESDRMLDQLIDIKINREDTDEDEFNPKDQQRIWGRFLDENGNLDREAYEFLNQTFDEYTSDVDNMDVNLEKRYRDLCKCELRKRKADESGDIQEISKAQDLLNKQLSLLSLNDFKKQDQDERKKFIDKIAWMIEETEPAEEEDEEKYRDIAGYEKIYNSWMRSMQNILCRDKNYPDIPSSEI